jgi:hypothetical protein
MSERLSLTEFHLPNEPAPSPVAVPPACGKWKNESNLNQFTEDDNSLTEEAIDEEQRFCHVLCEILAQLSHIHMLKMGLAGQEPCTHFKSWSQCFQLNFCLDDWRKHLVCYYGSIDLTTEFF